MDRLQAMQTFVRVVEAGSFSAVARELGTTQSAVSKQVAGLEAALGARLLTRTTRALALTEDGSRYFEDARRLVAELAEAEGRLRGGERQLQGLLRVAAAVAFGRKVLLPHVRSFLAAHPGVSVDLRLNDNFVDLVEQGIDVAVRIGELADSSLVARRVGTFRRAAMASRRYLQSLPRAHRSPRAPADLAHHNCIVYTELAMRGDWPFEPGKTPQVEENPPGPATVVRVSGNLQTNSSEAVRAAVLGDMGTCYAPTWLFEDEIARGEVVVLLPHWPMRPMPIHLVTPVQRKDAAKVKAFCDHVARALA